MTTVSTGSIRWTTGTGQVLRRWLLNLVRQPFGVVMSLIQPIVWIVLFGQVFKAVGSLPGLGTGGYIDYLVPGVLMMTVLYSGAWSGTAYVDDAASGVLDQWLTSPVHRTSIVIGQLLQQLVVMGLQGCIVLAIGALAGARYGGGAGGMALSVGASLLLAVPFCCFSSVVALLTRNQFALIGVSQLIVLPATFLSSAMMPKALLPTWVQHVSQWNPLTWAVDLARTMLAGNALPAADLADLAGLVVLSAVAVAATTAALAAYSRSR